MYLFQINTFDFALAAASCPMKDFVLSPNIILNNNTMCAYIASLQITPVFISLVALILAATIYFFIRKLPLGASKNEVFSHDNDSLLERLQERERELIGVKDSVRAMQEQLIQSEKMSSLGQLTAGIAHEIQNPLNFVNNFSEISTELIDELEKSNSEEHASIIADLKQNLQKILFHGKRAESIVKGMLLHSRTSPGEKQATDINKLVEEFFILAFHGMRAKDPSFNCLMDKHLSPDLPMVKIVPQDVSRVILNIFNNSFYAVDEKSRTEGKNYRPTVSIATQKINGHIVLTIRDNGRGIPDEIRKKIFTPFFTTKPVGKGTGLGLSISHDIIVKQHEGQIDLQSKQGEFTEFKITLPIK